MTAYLSLANNMIAGTLPTELGDMELWENRMRFYQIVLLKCLQGLVSDIFFFVRL